MEELFELSESDGEWLPAEEGRAGRRSVRVLALLSLVLVAPCAAELCCIKVLGEPTCVPSAAWREVAVPLGAALGLAVALCTGLAALTATLTSWLDR